MPSNTGLNIGSGIADGASAFTQAFLQARQQKNALELTKNDRLANLLLDQIKDDNTSHYKRTALVDEYQKLYDPKAKMPLSQILGMHKLNDEDYQTGTAKQNPQVPTVNQDNSVNAVPAPENQNLPQVPTYKKFGDTTPNEVKQKLQLDLEGVRDQRQIAHAKQLYQDQVDILGKNGYTIPVSDSYDEKTSTYTKVMMNSAGETKLIKLENFKPTTLMKAEITAKGSGAPKGKLGQLQTAQEIVTSYEADPTAVPKANYNAAKSFLEDFEKTGQVKDAQVTSLNQTIKGTRPPTPQQNISTNREELTRQTELQKEIDKYTGEEAAALTAREVLGTKKDIAGAEYSRANQAFAKIQNNYSPNDPEWKDAEKVVKEAKKAYDDLERDYGKKHEAYIRANANKTSALERQANFGGSSSSNPNMDLMIQHYDSNIRQFKKDNPTATLSDIDIINLLRAKHIIK